MFRYIRNSAKSQYDRVLDIKPTGILKRNTGENNRSKLDFISVQLKKQNAQSLNALTDCPVAHIDQLGDLCQDIFIHKQNTVAVMNVLYSWKTSQPFSHCSPCCVLRLLVSCCLSVAAATSHSFFGPGGVWFMILGKLLNQCQCRSTKSISNDEDFLGNLLFHFLRPVTQKVVAPGQLVTFNFL